MLLAAAVSAACQTDVADGTQSVADGYVRFSSGEITQTRTVVGKEEEALTVAWDAGDLVGIYGSAEARSLGDNFPYEVQEINEENGACVFRCVNPGQAFQNPVRNNIYYAYYPYDEDAGTSPEAVALSLPAEQYQSAAGSTENPANLGFMKAVPTAITDPAAGVNFEFHNVFAIVELKLRMNAASSMNSVPIRSIRMSSSSTDLVAPQAEIDLTAPVETSYSVLPVTVKEGGRSVILTFSETAQLTKQDGSFYFVVLPGSHPAGDITLEVTAIDNSVNTVVLPGDVEFRSNRHYAKSVELALDGFKQKEQFDVTPADRQSGRAAAIRLLGKSRRHCILVGRGRPRLRKIRHRRHARSIGIPRFRFAVRQRLSAQLRFGQIFDRLQRNLRRSIGESRHMDRCQQSVHPATLDLRNIGTERHRSRSQCLRNSL